MYEPLFDSIAWAMAADLVLTNNVPVIECELCNSTNVIDLSIYNQATSAFTGYTSLCSNCANTLGFTIMIEGD